MQGLKLMTWCVYVMSTSDDVHVVRKRSLKGQSLPMLLLADPTVR